MMTLLCLVDSEQKTVAQDYIGIDKDDFPLKLGVLASCVIAIARIPWRYYFDKTPWKATTKLTKYLR